MPKTAWELEANTYTNQKEMFMGWSQQIKDCQGSIPAADGKDQGFRSRAEMTSHWAVGEMMYHLAVTHSGQKQNQG